MLASGDELGLPQLTLDNQVGSEDTHGTNTNPRLGSSICSTKAGEHNSRGAAHSTEEWLYDD
jgi:hypothetical protein